MISYIKWEIKNIDISTVIILPSSWVWYEFVINELIFSKIHDKKEVELFVFHAISENWQSLFWFLDLEDRVLFKELIKISWVWWRVAQTILSLWSQRLKQAILDDDKKTLESIKWVGKKMAEKIVLELQDKDIVKNAWFAKQDSKSENETPINKDLKKEILTSLTLMWYNPKKIEEILQNLPSNYSTIESIIPYVIKNIW